MSSDNLITQPFSPKEICMMNYWIFFFTSLIQTISSLLMSLLSCRSFEIMIISCFFFPTPPFYIYSTTYTKVYSAVYPLISALNVKKVSSHLFLLPLNSPDKMLKEHIVSFFNQIGLYVRKYVNINAFTAWKPQY